MICPICGTYLTDDLNFCTQCGAHIEKQASAEPEYSQEDVYNPRADVYSPEATQDGAYYAEPAQEPVYYNEYESQAFEPVETAQDGLNPPLPDVDPGKGLGIASMVVSIVGTLLCNLFGITPIVGIVLGIVANSKSKKAGFKNGFAIAGISVGAVGTVLSIIACIVFLAIFLIPLLSMIIGAGAIATMDPYIYY